MTSTETDFRCLNCNATPSAREMADGWCDSCGKRLPDSYAAKAKGTDSAKARLIESATKTKRSGRGVLLAIAALGVVAVVAVIVAS